MERVGIHDNFFDKGGHSLLATAVTTRANSVLDVNLAVRTLFETPTIAALAAEVVALRAGGSDRAESHLARVPRDDGRAIPLSFAQQRLWFLEQLEGNLAYYNMPGAWRIRGPLDVESLRRALETILERHEPLRTVFGMQDGEPFQQILPPRTLDLERYDLRQLPEADREVQISQRAHGEAEKPFDLAVDLPLRTRLLQLSDEEHVLLLTQHHIASDGWSQQVMWRELKTLYAAYLRGEVSPLPELPCRYVDYAVWQRQRLEGNRLQAELDYWQKQLAGLEPLELPTDRPRPSRPTYRAGRQTLLVEAPIVRGLRELSHESRATLQITLLAAFQVLLHRYSSQENLAVGVPIAGRLRPEFEPMIGFFVNTLVMRGDLSGEPTFRELLARVRETSLEAYDHQELPFEKLVEELNPERHLSRHPLFQVVFQLSELARSEPALPGLEVRPLAGTGRRVRFDLEMHLRIQPGLGLRGTILYSTDLFDAATIERMAGHFQTLLVGIVADPETKIGRLPLLTEAERRQLLVDWNDTRRDYPRDECVHELFEEQAARTPDAAAVVFGDAQITFRELNANANQLAHYLRNLGVGPDVLVGLCVDRSFKMADGILGILKAGGAYVPLDPALPRGRLASMLEDASVSVLVTQSSLVSALPDYHGQTVLLDVDARLISSRERSNPAVAVTSSNLAYVLFTSGSTGRPKGVAMPHRPLVNLLGWHARNLRLREPARTLQFAPLTFDVSFQDLVATWCTGGTAVLVSDSLRLDPAAILQFLETMEIERLYVPFVVLQQLAEVFCQNPAGLGHLRDIVSAGEALRLTADIRSLLGHRSRCRLHNHYGPTECHVVTSETLPADPAAWPDEAFIGRPLSNVSVYVLDGHLQPVPLGVAGDLCIGGDCLARGYLNDPGLTAECFVANPFLSGERLYRTGDVVRMRTEGLLEFLGRRDSQVTIRGFRVEPGEIETVLREHPGVMQCVVRLGADRPGDQRLLCYYVPADGHPLTHSDLTRHVREKLPEHMVPSAFIPLERLPLTTHGKIDHRALPEPNPIRPDLGTGYVAPRSALEDQLAEIWAEVLGLRARRHPRQLLRARRPLAAGHAGHRPSEFRAGCRAWPYADFSRRQPSRHWPPRSACSAPAAATRARTRLAPGAPGRRACDPALLRPAATLVPGTRWKASWSSTTCPSRCGCGDDLDAESLRRALETILERHEPLRTTFRLQDGEPAQGHSASVAIRAAVGRSGRPAAGPT